VSDVATVCAKAVPCIVQQGGGSDTAWLAAAATVGAALIAAAFAYGNEARKSGLVRMGIARLLEDDMRRQQSVLTRAWARGAWWREAEMREGRVTPADQQVVVTALYTSEWVDVSTAIGWMETVIANHKPRGAALMPNERVLVKETWHRLETGRRSLKRVATPWFRRILLFRWWPRGLQARQSLEFRPHDDLEIQESEVSRRPDEEAAIRARGRISEP
jgi:hypothetical protein